MICLPETSSDLYKYPFSEEYKYLVTIVLIDWKFLVYLLVRSFIYINGIRQPEL